MAAGTGLGLERSGNVSRRGATGHGFGKHSPDELHILGKRKTENFAMVVPTSALLEGASSVNADSKSGPMAAIKFSVSARLKLPCMP